MITINIYDIISALIISLQSMSFVIFIKKGDYIKRVIYSIQIFILAGIILTMIDIVFSREAYFIKWYSYITLILGIYNIVRLMFAKIKISMLKTPVKIGIIVITVLIIFTLFIYIKISKDVYYMSWDYIAYYYPNSLRLIEKEFITPELYIPAFLYGAPEIVTSITSNLIVHNLFGAPLYFYVLSIITIVIIAKDLNKSIFILFNPIILILYLSYFGYTEYVIIWLLTTSYYVFRHFEETDIIYFVISFWLSFFTKPHVALAFLNIILYLILKKIFKNKYIIIIKILIIIEYLMVLTYSINVYTFIKFSVYSIIFLLILFDIMIKSFRYIKYEYKNDFETTINYKIFIYMFFVSLPFIIEGIYIFVQTKLFFITPLVSPWLKEEVRKWSYPVENLTFKLYYNFNDIILVIFLITYIVFKKYIINYNQISNLELVFTLGLIPSLFVVLNYWPREFIRRIVIIYFYEILSILTIMKENYKVKLLNLFYLVLFQVSFITYYYHDIVSSWFEVTYLSFLKSVPSILVALLIFLILIANNHNHKYVNFNNTLKVVIVISLFLLIIIELVTTLNINSIAYSREYMAVNYWTINLISNLSLLNSSSTLTCGFGINKVIGLRSYDFSSLGQVLFIYVILNKGSNFSYFNITKLIYFDTPIGSACIEILNNKTIPILSKYVSIYKISR